MVGDDYITSVGEATRRVHAAVHCADPHVKDALTPSYYNEAFVPWSHISQKMMSNNFMFVKL